MSQYGFLAKVYSILLLIYSNMSAFFKKIDYPLSTAHSAMTSFSKLGKLLVRKGPS